MSTSLQFHERDEYEKLLEDSLKWQEALVLLVFQTIVSAYDSQDRNRQAFLAMDFFINHHARNGCLCRQRT